MTTRPRFLPIVVLLAGALLAGCGGRVEEAPPVEVQTVDPSELEADVDEPMPDPEPVVEAWAPAIEAVPAGRFRATLGAAADAVQAGRLLGTDAPALPAGADEAPAPEPGPGALELYLGILATDPAHAEALAGVGAVVDLLLLQGRAALAEGRLADGQRVERVLVRAMPQHAGLASYRQAIEAATRAQGLVRRGDARASAGRLFKPEGKGAVAAYREALQAYPDFIPASDGLARLQADHLNRALLAAQQGDYTASERLQADAARILPASTALQDMAARIVELRQDRTEQLLAQGHAAVDALDLELAAGRLAEAERVSLQARGLDALGERIALARHYGRFRPGQVFREPLAAGGEGPEMVVLPHGSFAMGSPDTEAGRQDSEGPRHEVRFERGLAMARSETTVAEFGRFVAATGYRSVATRRGRSTVYDERGGAMSEHSGVDWRRDHAGNPAGPTLPVVHVAFEDAEAYVAWLSAQTGERYRLPSEAEFEYALRAGGSGRYPWGNAEIPPQGSGNFAGGEDVSPGGRRWNNAFVGFGDGYWGPAPAGRFQANAWGLHDLAGNVSEWVADCWHDGYRRAPTQGEAWVNPGCRTRVVRGGAWSNAPAQTRAAWRSQAEADATNGLTGFRVVRDL